jgi:hydroxymethylbilane synthase
MEVVTMNLRIATRKSKLAQVQAEIVMKMLKDKLNIASEKYLMDTEGDRKLDVSLDKIGGKGLFTKDIEYALLENRADAAVHSMKDVPYEISDVFAIAAMPVREDVRDVLISRGGILFKDLPHGAVIGTSSKRRSDQLKLMRPDIQTVPIRGNVQTRIDKIEKENLDGIVLAAAGVKRLGIESIVSEYFSPLQVVPAVGQGALGIEVHKKNPNASLFNSLDNVEVRMCVEAERSFMSELKGGCHTSLGAYAVIEGSSMNIIGVFDVGNRLIKKEVTGNKENYIELGKVLARIILNS